MIIEENKANEKECVQQPIPNATHRCSGSRCMAWRWARTGVDTDQDGDAPAGKRSETHGFCGLAGRP